MSLICLLGVLALNQLGMILLLQRFDNYSFFSDNEIRAYRWLPERLQTVGMWQERPSP